MTDAATSAPLAGASVATRPLSGTATTDGLGNYSLKAAPGTYSVLFSAPGYNSNFSGSVGVNANATTAANKSLVGVPLKTSMDLFSRPDDPGPVLGTASDGHVWANDLSVYPTCVSSISSQTAYLQGFTTQTDCDTWMGDSYLDSELTADFNMAQVLVDPYYQHGARILSRVQNGGSDWILIAINPTQGKIAIWTTHSGVWRQLASTPVAVSTNTWYHAKVDIVGSTVSVKIWDFNSAEPGWLITTSNQTDLAGPGQSGIRAAAADVYFSNVKITQIG